MAMEYVKMFYDWTDKASELTDEEYGALMRAIMKYARGETVPELVGGAKFLFPVFRIYVDREADAYDEMCEKRREAGLKSGIARRKLKNEQVLNVLNTSEQMRTNANKMNQEKENENEKEEEKENDIFIYNQEKEPCIDEIKKYITENNLKIDGEEFFDHYSAIGWKIGGNPIVDWKAALRRWARGAKKRETISQESAPVKRAEESSSFDTDDFFEAAVNRSFDKNY